MKITGLRCLGKTDKDGNLDDREKHITFVIDTDDDSEYNLTVSREVASNLHFALGKFLTETDFRFKNNY